MDKVLKTYRFEYLTLNPFHKSKFFIVKSHTLFRALKTLNPNILDDIVVAYSDYKMIPCQYLQKTIDRVIVWHEKNPQ